MKRDAELDYRRIIFAWDQFKDEAEKAAAHYRSTGEPCHLVFVPILRQFHATPVPRGALDDQPPEEVIVTFGDDLYDRRAATFSDLISPFDAWMFYNAHRLVHREFVHTRSFDDADLYSADDAHHLIIVRGYATGSRPGMRCLHNTNCAVLRWKGDPVPAADLPRPEDTLGRWDEVEGFNALDVAGINFSWETYAATVKEVVARATRCLNEGTPHRERYDYSDWR